MNTQTPVNFAVDFYGEQNPEGWIQLFEKAERYANRAWSNNISNMRKLAADFQHSGQFMLQQILPRLPFSDAHKLIAFGAQVAIREEAITERPLWVSLQGSIATAYYYGEALTGAEDYLSYAMDAARLATTPQLPKETKAKIEAALITEADTLSEKLDYLRTHNLPVPAAAAIVKTLQDLFPLLPDHLYQTLHTIWEDRRPDAEPPATKVKDNSL